MRIHLAREQAEEWFNKVCEALAGIDIATLELEERTRRRVIAKRNKLRRWIPFARPIQDDAQFNFEPYLPPLHDYFFRSAVLKNHERGLNCVFHTLSALCTGEINGVTLSRGEVRIIKEYQQCFQRKTSSADSATN